MIHEIHGIVTCIAWNEAVLPNSHWGFVSFSSLRLQIQISRAQTSLGALSVSGGRQSKSRSLSWPASGEGAWHRQSALPWLPGSALPMLDGGCRAHTLAKTLYSYCVWAQTAPCPRAEHCLPSARASHASFLASMSSKYPIKRHNCPHSSSCDSVSIHDPLLLPGPYKETCIKTSECDVNYSV